MNIIRFMLNIFMFDIKFIIIFDKKSYIWLSIRGCNFGWYLLFEVVLSEVFMFLLFIVVNCESW